MGGYGWREGVWWWGGMGEGSGGRRVRGLTNCPPWCCGLLLGLKSRGRGSERREREGTILIHRRWASYQLHSCYGDATSPWQLVTTSCSSNPVLADIGRHSLWARRREAITTITIWWLHPPPPRAITYSMNFSPSRVLFPQEAFICHVLSYTRLLISYLTHASPYNYTSKDKASMTFSRWKYTLPSKAVIYVKRSSPNIRATRYATCNCNSSVAGRMVLPPHYL